MTDAYQWRGYPWPHKVEGHGGPIGVEDYPFQGLYITVTVEPIPHWQLQARTNAQIAQVVKEPIPPVLKSGNRKYAGLYSPWGTPIGTIAREGHDILAAPCGLCGFNVAKCPCNMEGAPSGARVRPARRGGMS